MKHTLQQVFRSGKFVIGFSIFVIILLIAIIYPLVVADDPLGIIAQGTFFPPGIYVSTFDSANASTTYTLNLPNASAKRIASKLGNEERQAVKEWLIAAGVPEAEIDIEDTIKLMALWAQYYDPDKSIPGMTFAERRYYQRLDTSFKGILSIEGLTVAAPNPETGTLEQIGTIKQSDYVNIGEVVNVRFLPFGTDNFGRDILTELVSATGVSLKIGFVAGIVATLIGLTLGLLAGYVGGIADDIIMFITNLFIVIPSFVLLILIS